MLPVEVTKITMTQLETIKTTVRQIVVDNLPTAKPEQITDEAELFSLGLNSLNAVSLVLGLEDAFGFQFDLEEISFDSFRAINDIVNLVQQRQESAA